MNCPLGSADNAGILLDYTAGRLERRRKEDLERHLRLCGRCSAAVAEQTDLWAAMDLWEAPAVSMGFNRRVMLAVEASEPAPWYRRLTDGLRSGMWKPAVPLAAAAAVIATGFLLDHREVTTAPGTQGTRDVSVVSATEVDQMEKTLDDIQLLRQFDAAATSRPL